MRSESEVRAGRLWRAWVCGDGASSMHGEGQTEGWGSVRPRAERTGMTARCGTKIWSRHPSPATPDSSYTCEIGMPPRAGSVSWSRMIGFLFLIVAAISFLQLPEAK